MSLRKFRKQIRRPIEKTRDEPISLYQYQPLDIEKKEIRILALQPGKFDDPITISIHHTPLVPIAEAPSERLSLRELKKTLPKGTWAYESLDGRYFFRHDDSEHTHWNHPDGSIKPSKYGELSPDVLLASVKYEALSYVWGPEVSRHIITVVEGDYAANALSSVKIPQHSLQIRGNLCSALKHLRFENDIRHLWVDAICIDQSNIDERNHEVLRMGDIYRLAYRVIIWLGDRSEGTKSAFSEMKRIGKQVMVNNSAALFCSPQGDYDRVVHVSSTIKRLEMDTIHTIRGLLSRPYFNRLWVWQEVRSSSLRAIVHCGEEHIHWPMLASSATVFTIQDHDTSLRVAADTIRQLFRESLPDIETITTSWTKLCEDPRDHVYAVSGILSPALASKIQVQYSSPVKTVFQQFFFAHLEVTQRLELPFPFCDSSKRRLDRPSWIPDFTMRGVIILPYLGTFASGHSAAVAKLVGTEILEVTGVLCSIVEETNNFVPNVKLDNATEVIEKWRLGDAEILDKIPYGSSETLLDAFCGVLSCNRYEQSLRSNHWPASTDWKEMVRQVLGRSKSSLHPVKVKSTQPLVLRIISENVMGRKFFKMLDGHIGLGPASAEPGDIICVILGAYHPVILRPTSNEQYTVIGDCYVHGLSGGEALLGAMPAPWKVTYPNDETANYQIEFYNTETGETSKEDQRLGPIPDPWVRIPYDREPHDPYYFDKFKNTATGEVINSDPRMFPDALKARGVELRKFHLV